MSDSGEVPLDQLHWLLFSIKVPVVYVFLLRFPILCMLFLVGFRWIALKLKPDLLANLFDVNGPGTFLVTLTALLCAWSIFLTGWTIYSHGPERFWIGRWSSLGPPPLWGFGVAGILGLICVSGVFSYSPAQNPSRGTKGLWLGVALGATTGLLILLGMRPLATWLGNWHLAGKALAWVLQMLVVVAGRVWDSWPVQTLTPRRALRSSNPGLRPAFAYAR